jgi:tetratricopeptide (TPR) repeat protein
MLLKGLNSREAANVGASLADGFVLQTGSGPSPARREQGGPAQNGKELKKLLQKFLQQVDCEARSLHLNIFKRAIIANSFKWRLLERGVEREMVGELTQALVLRLTTNQASAASADVVVGAASRRRSPSTAQTLLTRGDERMAQGAYAEAVNCYQELLTLDSGHAVAHNNLGAALCKLGHYGGAEDAFRRAIGIRASYADAHCNLGTLLRWRGRFAPSETSLRRALQLKPTHVEAQIALGTTLIPLGRVREAKDLLKKALLVAPRNVAALVAMGEITGLEGHLAEAEAFFKRALAVDPQAPGAWAALVRLRRMTPADSAWLKGAEASVSGSLAPLDEANLRYAIGKYCDDVGDFRQAFRSYQRANELQKAAADAYDRDARKRLVDDLLRAYTRETLSQARAGACDSRRPVFVVGMPRSGTSLVEQVIASHPAAKGAGELGFWVEAVRKHETVLRHEPPAETLRRKLAAAYLRVLARYSPDALRVVDKTPFNSDYLGLIHAVFPNARIIYLRRDPIDTCLSCYFQPFTAALNFTMDLADLAHYYREHQRLIAHWRGVLPSGTLFEVPYAELVADQEGWTRNILDFLGLEWDERCLDFQKTDRTVLTASFWQVRQEIYRRSAGRWRNYERFIAPLLELGDTDT